jgi:predicted nucleic acid-binding protein
VIVVSDTSAICYLILIGEIDLLPALFGKILIPQRVRSELASPGAPEEVRAWIEAPPEWLEIRAATSDLDPASDDIHAGELEVLALANDLPADLVILDDRAARQQAAALGLRFTGLLGVLDRAARRRQVDLRRAVSRLRRTNFRVAPALLRSLLRRHSQS